MLSLLDQCHWKKDLQAQPYKLHYLRTKDGNEVDFALIYNDHVKAAIEVNVSDDRPSNALQKFYNKYGFPSYQVVQHLFHKHQVDGI